MRTFVKFSVAGAIGFLSDYLAFIFMSQWVSMHLARPLCFLLAVNVTFFINKHYAFRGYNARYAWYLAGQMKALLINYAAFEILWFILRDYAWGRDVAFVIAAFCILLFNFMYSRLLAFRKA